MKITNILVGAMAAASTLAILPAQGASIVGSTWQPFLWSNPFGTYGGQIIDSATGDESYTFTLTGNARLNITDAFYNLDTFDVTINGIDQGEIVPADTHYAYIDPFDPSDPGNTIHPASWDTAFGDPHFSHATYDLGPGTYTVTATVPYSVYNSGLGALELVPEPAGWALMLLGFGMVGGLVRRRAGQPVAA